MSRQCVEVVRMNAFCPSITKLLLQSSTGKVEPAFVEEGAEFVRTGHPDEHGRGVGDRAKTLSLSRNSSSAILRLVMSRDTPRPKAGLPLRLTRHCHNPRSSACFRPAE